MAERRKKVATLCGDYVFSEPQMYGKDEIVKDGIFEDLEISLHDIFD